MQIFCYQKSIHLMVLAFFDDPCLESIIHRRLPKGGFSFLFNEHFHALDFFNSFFKNRFIYLFMAALGLRCCARAFSSCSERGLLFVAVLGLLIAVASLVAERGLQ